MSLLLGILRLLAFAIVTFTCILVYILLSPIHRFSLQSGYRLRKTFIRIMLVVLNVQIKVYGKPDKNFKGIIVANHRSYFDPIAILNYIDAVTVAKAEVSNWPLIGLGARMAGTVWVKREEKDSRKAARDKIAELSNEGINVLIFPEGTSSTSAQMLEVRNAVFQIAAEKQIPLLPLAIEFEYESEAWVGDDTFIRHFVECFGKWQTRVGLYFNEPVVETDAKIAKGKTVNAINQSISFLRLELRYCYRKKQEIAAENPSLSMSAIDTSR